MVTVSRWNVTSENIYKKSTWFFWFHVQYINISDIFYKMPNLKKWLIKAVVPFLPRNLKLHNPLKKLNLTSPYPNKYLGPSPKKKRFIPPPKKNCIGATIRISQFFVLYIGFCHGQDPKDVPWLSGTLLACSPSCWKWSGDAKRKQAATCTIHLNQIFWGALDSNIIWDTIVDLPDTIFPNMAGFHHMDYPLSSKWVRRNQVSWFNFKPNYTEWTSRPWLIWFQNC